MKNYHELADRLVESFSKDQETERNDVDLCLVYSFLSDVRKILTLNYINPFYSKNNLEEYLEKADNKLRLIFAQSGLSSEDIDAKAEFFMSQLPEARRLVYTSMEAILNGDPASTSIQEIVTCYPGFSAILNYRIANILYHLGLIYISRIISEEAHRSTGIDINPGATIGEYFFIDHGTGIVIGETCIIGNNVKLYQGVTLGARSLSKGRLLVGMKRHPTIGNNVTIYSSASILGGDTGIGDNTTIGGNVYVTSSVKENSIVFLGNTGIKIIDKVENYKK
ncbi:MAG: serine acetyltransferase [Bacilli bacterium]